MPLTELWKSNPQAVLKYNIRQIVSVCGDGILADDSECSRELRGYLKDIPAEKIFEYIEYGLSNPFEKSGYVLQDIVNELGRRLDYEATDGIYQGRSNRIGYDGIWRAPDGHTIILEIKTSTDFTISLDVIASYRDKLIETNGIGPKSSILIVVGRGNTADLEAQIRGSRHAWDIRVISVEALMKLVDLKIHSDEEETVQKIRGLIVPFEYTRLDNIIDVVFSTTKDAEADTDEAPKTPELERDERIDAYEQDHTPREQLEQVRQEALEALGAAEGTKFIAYRRAQYWTSDRQVRAVCPVSKVYQTGYFWYGLHPHQIDFLDGGEKGFLLLGCVDHAFAYAIPSEVIKPLLPFMNVTEKPDRMYWHIHLAPSEFGSAELVVPRKGQRMALAKYRLPVAKPS